MGWDDALDVWGVHGMGGVLGTILLGVFGTKAVQYTAGAAWPVGLLEGNADFFFTQIKAVVLASAYAFAFTYGVLWLIDRFVPVKLTAEEESSIDENLHGETAYEEMI